jgi:hypothetical protein
MKIKFSSCQMDPIKDIIPNVISKISQNIPDGAKDINTVWSRISGGTGSKIIALKNGTLTVHVDNAMRMVNLSSRRDLLIEEMQKEFKEIKYIHFRVGKI